MVKIRLKVVDIEDVELKRLGKEPNTCYHSIKGIVKKDSCMLPVKIGLVKNKLIDEVGNETKTFRSIVYCANSSDVPVIFGIKDGLDKFKLNLDIKQKDAWLIN